MKVQWQVRAKRTDRIKLIIWDGTGMCLFQTADNLYVGEAGCALSLILSMDQSVLQNGLFQWARSSPTSSPAAAEFAAGRLYPTRNGS